MLVIFPIFLASSNSKLHLSFGNVFIEDFKATFVRVICIYSNYWGEKGKKWIQHYNADVICIRKNARPHVGVYILLEHYIRRVSFPSAPQMDWEMVLIGKSYSSILFAAVRKAKRPRQLKASTGCFSVALLITTLCITYRPRRFKQNTWYFLCLRFAVRVQEVLFSQSIF